MNTTTINKYPAIYKRQGLSKHFIPLQLTLLPSGGDRVAIRTIQVSSFENEAAKGHSFELMSGEQKENTTAPNRSIAIRTRL